MYINQTEGIAFHDVIEALPAGMRASIEGVAQRALHAAGVVCSMEDEMSYTAMISREQLQDLPGIQQAQAEMRSRVEAF